MQPLRIHIGGIKCDNPECDFNDMSVLFSDYSKWLNKLCPKCGSNLLTQQDFDTAKVLMGLVEIVNEVMPEAKDDDEIFKMSVNFDGGGKATFSEIKPVETMICPLCGKELHPLDAKFSRLKTGEFDAVHIDCWNEHYKEEIEKERKAGVRG